MEGATEPSKAELQDVKPAVKPMLPAGRIDPNNTISAKPAAGRQPYSGGQRLNVLQWWYAGRTNSRRVILRAGH